MTTTGLEVRLREGRERAAVHRFTKTLDDLVLALREIDKSYLTHGSRPTWVIAGLNHESSGDMIVRLEARSPSRTRPLEDMLLSVEALVDGVNSLGSLPEVPRFYSPETVGRITRIATPSEGFAEVSVASYNGKINSRAVLTSEVRQNAELALQGKEVSYGSISGTLDTVSSAPARNILRARIYDEQTQRAVAGVVSQDLSESLRQHWNHRVLVGGLITRNGRGQALKIEIDQLERLPENDLGMPSPAELLGIAPTWLNGENVDDYMGSIRGA
ncbi:hypothetical protein QK290_13480 [Pseudarthrobacter sp. AL07]|uniref:hypothetical protein n=1 Tax=unclassified Pseudarthrobacter TaxID=2647000 RepID=UPI00249B67BB|nr:MULTISPECIES: hypothetical protein [unclassified Pseudarthrobacter]MDI3195427.1 hypothetical protein [Pseudarthrobacter sp. AL20]MDI3209493.1 hypothetical protein [Pseudarthrobacter sp. AL07]